MAWACYLELSIFLVNPDDMDPVSCTAFHGGHTEYCNSCLDSLVHPSHGPTMLTVDCNPDKPWYKICGNYHIYTHIIPAGRLNYTCQIAIVQTLAHMRPTAPP